MSLDVLIVGAGPTGLLLAAQLARHGIKPRLIDKQPQPSTTSKALAVFARTLEIFDKLGIVEEAIDCGCKIYGANIHDDGKRFAHISIDKIDSFFPFVLSLPQSETERILAQLVESLDVHIERPVSFTTLEQDREGVTATLCHPDGQEESCRAAWLIGCDGAHSSVRKPAGLGYQGIDIQATFVLADLKSDWQLSPDNIQVFFSSSGVLAAFPLPGENNWRIIANVPPDIELPENPELQIFQQLTSDRCGLQATLGDPTWTSKFSIRQRIVDKCRAGRVFVAGDALASHSPVGGQGMNTGLQDAYNLAWKLALVIKNQAPIHLLDSYQAEREPVSKFLLLSTEWATRAIVQSNPTIKFLRRHLASFATSFAPVQQRITNTLSELNVNYRNSPIVQDGYPLSWLSRSPKAGDRAPDVLVQTDKGQQRLYHVLADTQHHLLLFGGKLPSYTSVAQMAQEIESKFPYVITVHIVLIGTEIPKDLQWQGSILLDPQGECHRSYGASSASLYLIRPDGYIGYRCQGADVNKLMAYLQKVYLFQSTVKSY
ncbi:FAD-dependent monooxygenase [Chlorogloeopsis sp. ULAP01]|uniref:FAD-dependent monooxygenase n=1 Tax=Chlorogloeopsis sp. ULAP01 TaxID=3056483 RepID=UPI0025AABF42|nr:FAD-dependent monooxygenase [Chlorogloeopsis sp. ULAP01]MDM9379764.1 FAD-dependent monooxygenase [Chlorogloeopsis sp. ULAP01]